MPQLLNCPSCPRCLSLDTEHILLDDDTIRSERLLWICLDCGEVWRAPVQTLPSLEESGPSVLDPRPLRSGS